MRIDVTKAHGRQIRHFWSSLVQKDSGTRSPHGARKIRNSQKTRFERPRTCRSVVFHRDGHARRPVFSTVRVLGRVAMQPDANGGKLGRK